VLFPRKLGLSALAAALLVASSAHALERVNLSTGFSYDCAAHELLDATHIRLYQTADRANFQDIAASLVTSIDLLPDPPALIAVPMPLSQAASSTTDIPTLLHLAGNKHNIDVDLLYSVVHAESSFNSRAVSRTGARGLMQLMPGTAAGLGVDDAFRADQNIAGGSTYLDDLLIRYKDDLVLALAAYNAGPAAVDRYHGVPPYRETRAYVARVITEFKRRKLALEKTMAASTRTASHTTATAALTYR
jgi:soluble lytic murein transglycosylase-like protein